MFLHSERGIPPQSISVKLTFGVDRWILWVLLQRECLFPHPDPPGGEVRPVNLPLLAKAGQELHRLHGVAPLVVAGAGIYMNLMLSLSGKMY